MKKPDLQLVHLNGLAVEEQLYLEEALLRLGLNSVCLINWKAPPAIVMGVSGKAPAWIHLEELSSRPIPVIQRYSGGGTVVIGPDTLLISFIMDRTALPHIAPYPEAILDWSCQLYAPLFDSVAALHPFTRIEQDYTLGGKKCGGNAQYLSRQRWVHHTSWLWDYTAEQMQYLKPPPKQPIYRQGRQHMDFLTPLCRHFVSVGHFIQEFMRLLQDKFTLEEADLEEIKALSTQPHRRTTRRLNLNEL